MYDKVQRHWKQHIAELERKLSQWESKIKPLDDRVSDLRARKVTLSLDLKIAVPEEEVQMDKNHQKDLVLH